MQTEEIKNQKLTFYIGQTIVQEGGELQEDLNPIKLQGTPEEILNVITKTSQNLIAFHIAKGDSDQDPDHEKVIEVLKEIF